MELFKKRRLIELLEKNGACVHRTMARVTISSNCMGMEDMHGTKVFGMLDETSIIESMRRRGFDDDDIDEMYSSWCMDPIILRMDTGELDVMYCDKWNLDVLDELMTVLRLKLYELCISHGITQSDEDYLTPHEQQDYIERTVHVSTYSHLVQTDAKKKNRKTLFDDVYLIERPSHETCRVRVEKTVWMEYLEKFYLETIDRQVEE